MNMIGQQVNKLRLYAKEYERMPYHREIEGTSDLLKQAADTIESLSAKLAAANIERPSRYYGEEKKLIEAMAEEIENCYGRETQLSEMERKVLGAFAED